MVSCYYLICDEWLFVYSLEKSHNDLNSPPKFRKIHKTTYKRGEKKTSMEWITYLSGRKKALDSIPSIQEVTYVFV